MRKLNTQSRLVRFAYSIKAPEKRQWTGPETYVWSHIPARTSLCAFFWRAFVFVPLAYLSMFAFALLCFVFVLAGGVMFWKAELVIFATGAVAFPIVAMAIGIANEFENNRDGLARTVEAIEDSTFVQGVFAIKSRVCPILEISHE